MEYSMAKIIDQTGKFFHCLQISKLPDELSIQYLLELFEPQHHTFKYKVRIHEWSKR